MSKISNTDVSLSEVHGSVETNVKGNFWKRLFAFLGPAYLVSVGYMDPGNWATDLAGGSRFGYQLLWVLLMSNLIALLLQSLSARLGVVARRDLAQASRELYHPAANIFNYILAEIAIAATDLAEVVGMAIGLQLLFGIPLTWGVAISVLDAFLLLFLMQLGVRKLEAFILGLVLIIGGAFAVQMILAKPELSEVATGFVPSIPNTEALFIAIGIIGATVMPHNLYLHSALVQTRKIERSDTGIRRAIKYNVIDSAIALNMALFVNAAILILAAAVFHKHGYDGVSEIQDAHRLLEPLLGKSYAPVLFAIALIAAGQSSTVTGTLAGQIVMEGYLRLRIAPWLRRIITRLLAVVPAILVITIMGESATGNMLVLSQVILSMQLGFAIIPLLHYVSDKKRMGDFAVGFWAKLGGWTSAAIIVALNVNLVIQQLQGWLESAGTLAWAIRFIVIPALLFAGGMLVYITLRPLLYRLPQKKAKVPHRDFTGISDIKVPEFKKIAVALDFSQADKKTLEHALHLGGKSAGYILIHAVETAGAWVMGSEIQDLETRSDVKNLEKYAQQLQEMGYQCEAFIGYGRAKKAIPLLVNEKGADILVMGAHGHRVLKDLIFGTTIGAVRHAVKIPVLIVR
ncbi:MAG: iron/manganese transporter [Haliscomenobacteraceae bacterium CHB4]|nr:iron/manganese transporter [Haliscomenobacteraceae bacterium CHB4]